MTRCPEYYDKMEKDGNFCGLSPGAISQIKAYNEMRRDIGKHIPDKELIVDNFPEFASRAITKIAKDGETKNWALDYVVRRLKKKEKVTKPELEEAIGEYLKSSGCAVEPRQKKVYVRKDETTVSNGTQTEEEQLPTSPSQPGRGTIEVTDAPPIKSLGELSREDDKTEEVLEVVTPKPEERRKAPCMLGQPCPDGKDHKAGKKCVLWGQIIGQFYKDECKLDVIARNEARDRTEDTGFVRASGKISTPPPSRQDLPIISKHPLLKSRQEQDAATSEFINNCLSDRYHRTIRDAMTDHNLAAPLDVICKGLDLLAEYEGEK